MAFEFLSNMDTTTLFLLLIIFILFVLAMKKILGIIKNAIIIAVAAVIFPIVMNRFFGFDIPMDPDSIISFIMLGLGVYFAYMIAKSIYKMLSLAEKAAKKAAPKIDKKNKPDKEEKNDKEEKEYKTDKSAREKELKKREEEISRKERQVRWASALEAQKGRAKFYDEKEYAVIKEPTTHREEKRSSVITPLPVIEHKPKKKKKQH